MCNSILFHDNFLIPFHGESTFIILNTIIFICWDNWFYYVGCYVDSLHTKDFDKSHGPVADRMDCMAMCKAQNYAYMARGGPNQCQCGNTFGRHGTSSFCDCEGKENKGDGVNCVYRLHEFGKNFELVLQLQKI